MIEKGNKVVLWKKDEVILVEVDGETKDISEIGIVDTGRFIGERWGSKISIGRAEYRLFQPTLKNAPRFFKRKAQIILPRVGVKIALYCDISSGKKVVEGGAGSGMLSAVIADKVFPDGELITYELREDFIEVAKSNLEKLGFEEDWKVVHGDVKEDVDERDVDAFVVDIPDPWEAVDMADKSLKNGGFFGAYVPSTDQLKRVVRKMKDHGYIGIKSFENLERDMVVKERGVRPSFDMLGHTGYVTVGRKTPDDI